MDFVQIAVCMFKRKATKAKADGWERGIAFVRAGDVDFIVDREGEKIHKPPRDWLVLSDEGSFVADLEVQVPSTGAAAKILVRVDC